LATLLTTPTTPSTMDGPHTHVSNRCVKLFLELGIVCEHMLELVFKLEQLWVWRLQLPEHLLEMGIELWHLPQLRHLLTGTCWYGCGIC